MVPHGDGWRWEMGDRRVAGAAPASGHWELTGPPGTLMLSLVTVRAHGRARTTLLDPSERPVATVVMEEGGAQPRGRNMALVQDSGGALILAAHADGPTGWHLVGPDGSVVALASPRAPARPRSDGIGGLDLMVVGEWRLGTCGVFAVLLALVLDCERANLPDRRQPQ